MANITIAKLIEFVLLEAQKSEHFPKGEVITKRMVGAFHRVKSEYPQFFWTIGFHCANELEYSKEVSKRLAVLEVHKIIEVARVPRSFKVWLNPEANKVVEKHYADLEPKTRKLVDEVVEKVLTLIKR